MLNRYQKTPIFMNRFEQNAIFRATLIRNGLHVTEEMENKISSMTICNTKEEAIGCAYRFAKAEMAMSYGI